MEYFILPPQHPIAILLHILLHVKSSAIANFFCCNPEVHLV